MIAVIEKMSRNTMHETFTLDIIVAKVSKVRTRTMLN
jgi:hypothetical protein